MPPAHTCRTHAHLHRIGREHLADHPRVDFVNEDARLDAALDGGEGLERAEGAREVRRRIRVELDEAHANLLDEIDDRGRLEVVVALAQVEVVEPHARMLAFGKLEQLAGRCGLLEAVLQHLQRALDWLELHVRVEATQREGTPNAPSRSLSRYAGPAMAAATTAFVAGQQARQVRQARRRKGRVVWVLRVGASCGGTCGRRRTGERGPHALSKRGRRASSCAHPSCTVCVARAANASLSHRTRTPTLGPLAMRSLAGCSRMGSSLSCAPHMRKRDGSGHTTTPDANARCVRLHTTPDANARCVRLHTTTPDANAPSVGPCGIERCRIRGTRSAPGGRVGATPCPAVRRRVTCDLLKLLAGVLCTAREYHLQHRLVHVATHLHKARPTHHGPCSSRAASVEGARGAHHGAAAP